MKLKFNLFIFLQVFLMPIGGLIVSAVAWLLYFGIFMFLESVIFANNLDNIPLGLIRFATALLFYLIYMLVYKTRFTDTIKATMLIPALAGFILTAMLIFNESTIIALISAFILSMLGFALVIFNKKNWVFYYAVLVATLIGIYIGYPITWFVS